MDSLLPWFAVAGAVTLINGSILGFIARHEQSRSLAHWACGWMLWAVAIVPLAVLGSPEPDPRVAVGCGLLWVASSLCFLSGSYAFADRRLPRGWLGIAAVCAALAVALGIGPIGGLGMVPLVLFQSVGLGATGVQIIRSARRRTGAWLCGGALIGLALHVLDAPLVAETPELLPWGFVVATALEILAALGMLMLHYEHARAQLLETQRALERSRRMEALGRIAGGVAHDFNNMLTVMRGHMDLIRLNGASRAVLDGSLESIDEAVERACRLTSQLLAFGRRSVVQPQSLDVREVVEGTLELLKKVIPANVQLRFSCRRGAYSASIDKGLLEQIVLNLVSNARDAIRGPGEILVELEQVASPKPEVVLRVVDDGSGMDEGLMNQIFEPFFTTKNTGQGTGLGLASVQGAVSQLGGQIHVESRVGQGTRFEIRLPWVAPDATPTAMPRLSEATPLDILLVDDDERVRHVTAMILETAGHRVQQASDGRQALKSIRARSYDMLLSDIVMPHMGGLQLLEEVSKLRPEMLVVLTSGYPLETEVDTSKVHFLPKPFQRTALISLLDRLMAQHRSRRAVSNA